MKLSPPVNRRGFVMESVCNGRQRGSGYGLTHPTGALIRQRGEQLTGALRILVSEHPLCLLQDQITALTGHDPA